MLCVWSVSSRIMFCGCTTIDCSWFPFFLFPVSMHTPCAQTTPTYHAHTTPMCRTTRPTIRELLRLKLTFLQNIPSNLQRYVMYSHTPTFNIHHIMWLTDSSLLEFHSQREIMGYLARLTTLATMTLLPALTQFLIICSTEKLWVTSRYTPSLLYHSHAPRSHSRLGSTIPTLMRRVRCAYLSSAPRIGNLPPKLTKVVTSEDAT